MGVVLRQRHGDGEQSCTCVIWEGTLTPACWAFSLTAFESSTNERIEEKRKFGSLQ